MVLGSSCAISFSDPGSVAGAIARLARSRLLDGGPILQLGVKDGRRYGIVTERCWPEL